MGKVGKKAPVADINETNTADEAELIYLQGLYSGFIVERPENSGGIPAKLNLKTYSIILIGGWVTFYVFLALRLAPLLERPVMGLSLAITGLAVFSAFCLLRSQQGLGVWPANRTAAMVILLMALDFWLWIFNGPFEGVAGHAYLILDIIGFAALLSGVYMFVFQRLHIEVLIKVLIAKGFTDFAAYILSGGFNIALLNAMGLHHPLNMDALFTIAMLELWTLLFYILKYRPKVMTLQME